MPGDSGPALVSVLEKIQTKPPNVDIPYDENTIYCFDSESFRYLVASVPPNNIQFDPKYKSSYVESWDRSVTECKRLFHHIIQLPAHKVIDTISVNNAKQITHLLTKPLADILKNIADNVKQCEEHSVEINEFSGTIEELNNKLYIPSVEIISVPFDTPKTVCEADECCKPVSTNGVTKKHYHMFCPSTSYNQFTDGGILGKMGSLVCNLLADGAYRDLLRKPGESLPLWLIRFGLLSAKNIAKLFVGTDVCQCGHSYAKHRHLLYDTQTKVTQIYDETIGNQIESTKTAAQKKRQLIRKLDQRMAALEAESAVIAKAMALFACFMANSALTPVGDVYEDYVLQLLASERYATTTGADIEDTTARLEQMLTSYGAEKEQILSQMYGTFGGFQGTDITAAQINNCVDKLSKLNHSGPYISKMLKE
ncbi:unnamed protein product, partial [Medioppia subpectinata]